MKKISILIYKTKCFFQDWIKIFIPATLVFVLGLIINTKYSLGGFLLEDVSYEDYLSKLPLFIQTFLLNNLTLTVMIASLISFFIGTFGAYCYGSFLMFISIPTNIICLFTGVIPFAVIYAIAAFLLFFVGAAGAGIWAEYWW